MYRFLEAQDINGIHYSAEIVEGESCKISTCGTGNIDGQWRYGRYVDGSWFWSLN